MTALQPALAQLAIGDFTDHEIGRIGNLLATIDLNLPGFFSQFGASEESAGASLDELSNLLEQSPVTMLATKMAEIVAKLSDADPRNISRKPNWLERLTGKSVESSLRYQYARKELESLLEEADVMAKQVETVQAKIEGMLRTHEEGVIQLRCAIAAGRLYLQQNPSAGQPTAGELTFENVRDRFGRKLANIAALLASHEMSVTQLKLTRSQSVDLLDRFHEVTRVLVPVWRQHTLALISSTKSSPEIIAAANKAHEALMASLTNLKNLEK
ncbi:protein KlaA [Chromobacterium piscinae]|uniref:protein KlaA n=1 Tax=Chromobacterium piscinae TaxID=686831 RepID=UPI001E2BD738|nr:protein KlaA [Chromobacterium piscinae]MCD5327971.1 protein KlaA [Chromobacterium piscinae]